MIREFFAPRLALFFFVFYALLTAGLYLWMQANMKQQRRWLTHARIAFIAGAIALVMTGAFAVFIQVLN